VVGGVGCSEACFAVLVGGPPPLGLEPVAFVHFYGGPRLFVPRPAILIHRQPVYFARLAPPPPRQAGARILPAPVGLPVIAKVTPGQRFSVAPATGVVRTGPPGAAVGPGVGPAGPRAPGAFRPPGAPTSTVPPGVAPNVAPNVGPGPAGPPGGRTPRRPPAGAGPHPRRGGGFPPPPPPGGGGPPPPPRGGGTTPPPRRS